MFDFKRNRNHVTVSYTNYYAIRLHNSSNNYKNSRILTQTYLTYETYRCQGCHLISIIRKQTWCLDKYSIGSLRSDDSDNLFAPRYASPRLVYTTFHNIYTVGSSRRFTQMLCSSLDVI